MAMDKSTMKVMLKVDFDHFRIFQKKKLANLWEN